MTYVVTQLCIDCKDTACVAVCPCDCFHEGTDMLYINPEPCIDCGACEPECPAEAIFHEDDVPEQFSSDIKLNEQKVMELPIIDTPQK